MLFEHFLNEIEWMDETYFIVLPAWLSRKGWLLAIDSFLMCKRSSGLHSLRIKTTFYCIMENINYLYALQITFIL